MNFIKIRHREMQDLIIVAIFFHVDQKLDIEISMSVGCSIVIIFSGAVGAVVEQRRANAAYLFLLGRVRALILGVFNIYSSNVDSFFMSCVCINVVMLCCPVHGLFRLVLSQLHLIPFPVIHVQWGHIRILLVKHLVYHVP